MVKISGLLLLFFIGYTAQTKANKIDSLNSDKEVQNFISILYTQRFQSDFHTFCIRRPDSVIRYSVCDSLTNREQGTWEKKDFNADGLTDLFTIIYCIDKWNPGYGQYQAYVVIDQTNNQFQLNEIPDYFLVNCYTVKSISVDDGPCLLYSHNETKYTLDTLPGMDTLCGAIVPKVRPNYFEVNKQDTLIYKFNGFIELNTRRKGSAEIKSIYYEEGPCFGMCPVFNLNIFADGSAFYLRQADMEVGDGNFMGKISQDKLNDIFSLMGYINIQALEDNYEVAATDLQTCKLKIYFSNGSVKEISDRGLQGTLGLVRLYHLLSELRHNQQWK